jgi:hypothetical protein
MGHKFSIANSWLGLLAFALMGAYLVYKYVLAVENRPGFKKNDILYQEWFASGRSLKNLFTRIGGAHACLRLVVTKDWLWVTSWFPFSLLAASYDLEHLIPLNRITTIDAQQRFGGREVHLTYVDKNGAPHALKLAPKNEAGFLRVIGDNRRKIGNGAR